MKHKSNANQDTFCSMLWNHQFIGPEGNIKPCCRFTMPKGTKFNIKETSLEDVFNSEFMQSVRSDSYNGVRNPGCRKCWQEEDAGKRLSLRQNYNRDVPLLGELHEDMDLDNPTITWLELSFSNRCNLRCRMCGPMFSTNWYKDWLDVKGLVPGAGNIGYSTSDTDIKAVKSRHNNEGSIDVDQLDSILPNIRHLKMTGGEPFIIPEYKEIIRRIVEYGNADKVYLNYSTNATVLPSKELLELWSHFKEVQIAASVDGVGPVIEYQRYPTQWSDIENTIADLMMLSHSLPISVGNRPTVTIYNVLDLPNLTEWWQSMMNKYYKHGFNEHAWFNPTHAASPEYLSLITLPDWAKQVLHNTLQNAPDSKQQENWNHLVKYCYSRDTWLDNKHTFQQFTRILDRKRNEKFEQIVPNFAPLMEDE